MILFAGPPGSGKSYQAQRLDEQQVAKWLSAGKLMRQTTDPEIIETIKKGKLVSMQAVVDTLVAALEQIPNDQQVIIDGFPRSPDQVVGLDELEASQQQSIEAIIHIKVSLEEALRRLAKRGRLDDSEETVRARYEMYQNEVVPAIEDVMHERGVMIEIDGHGSKEEVSKRIDQAISPYAN